jgi:hypothetical protein
MRTSHITAPEPLCNLRMIKAEYGLATHAGQAADYCFRIKVIPNGQDVEFDVPEKEGEVFAVELVALAAIIRSRVIRARTIGEELD